MAPAKPWSSLMSGDPSMFSLGTRQSVNRMVAVSDARMPSLCSSRSTTMPGRALLDHEGLDRGAAAGLVQGGPHDDGVGAAAGGDVDLLAVDDVVVAVEHRGGRHRRGVRAEAGLGDGHRGPELAEALELLLVGHRGDRGVAETLPRHGQHHGDVTPAGLHDRQDARHVGAVAVAALPSPGSRRTPRAPVPPSPPSFMPSTSAASASSSLGYSCSARSYLREMGRKISSDTWCAWLISMPNFFGVSSEMLIDQHTPSMISAARRSRYQRSTGCSLTKPCPPSSCTPSEPIFMPYSAVSLRAMAASRAYPSPGRRGWPPAAWPAGRPRARCRCRPP